MTIDLQEYINRESSSAFLKRVPSYSAHETLARKYINETLAKNKDYFGFAKAVAEYPVMKWGKISRERISLDQRHISTGYFGIEGEEFAQKQRQNHVFCDRIIDFVEKAINKSENSPILWSVHDYKAEGVSTYKINAYYRPAFEDLCEKNYREFNSLVEETAPETPEDDDVLFVYHKADILLRLKSVLEKSEVTDYQDTIDCIDRCISCFDSYYLKDPKFKKVISLYSQGFKEYRIAELTGKSRSYIRNMKEEAARALSYIIWGYVDE